ncbi:zinc ribbon domain-containing protein [Cognatishimia sp. SS12]|uniref:Zn-ribbon domain-containing OB-fold protein n=1 Tax=Cognatishimia sp. SS12 TaxID=2979465 RepID=UPI00233062E6|nr:OB-fold domain-containing protein [Cognatishimia sp. SS12]MDC0738916.1 zinc ribbon domain-containing protein [Cognatishimia sp. SS12]
MTDLSELKVPGPIFEPLNTPFWDSAAEGVLKIQHCQSCQSHVFYPRPICPHCWADALEWVAVSGQGQLKSYSEIHKPGHPGWASIAPYVVGLVRLREGPTLLSHILTDGQAPRVGAPVDFAPTRIGENTLPCFRLAKDMT